ncbi:hypothetical protein GXW82_03495 [Streptacidiphilus sp. 4-A2]|nr:hypothetical protein [Streptacidiphilus sp. 4-A2]
MRAVLLRSSAERSTLLVLMHHIATDGWSLEPLARDLGIAYRARLAERSPQWSELPVQYADFALWQAAHSSLVERQLDFWATELADLPEEIRLPLDRLRPAQRDYRGASTEFMIDPRTHEALLRIGRESNATLLMVLQAAVVVWLHRQGAGDDIPLGMPVAGRDDEALDDLVGFFVNTLVLRTDVGGSPTFRELLDRVRGAILRAYAHQDVPFERLVERLVPARTAARQPLFQVMFALTDSEETTVDLEGLEARGLLVELEATKFDLSVSFRPQRGPDAAVVGLRCGIEYAVDVFDESTVSTLARALGELLAEVVADPGIPVGKPLNSLTQKGVDPRDQSI